MHISHFLMVWFWVEGVVFSAMMAFIMIYNNNQEIKTAGFPIEFDGADALFIASAIFFSMACFCFSPVIGAALWMLEYARLKSLAYDWECDC